MSSVYQRTRVGVWSGGVCCTLAGATVQQRPGQVHPAAALRRQTRVPSARHGCAPVGSAGCQCDQKDGGRQVHKESGPHLRGGRVHMAMRLPGGAQLACAARRGPGLTSACTSGTGGLRQAAQKLATADRCLSANTWRTRALLRGLCGSSCVFLGRKGSLPARACAARGANAVG